MQSSEIRAQTENIPLKKKMRDLVELRIHSKPAEISIFTFLSELTDFTSPWTTNTTVIYSSGHQSTGLLSWTLVMMLNSSNRLIIVELSRHRSHWFMQCQRTRISPTTFQFHLKLDTLLLWKRHQWVIQVESLQFGCTSLDRLSKLFILMLDLLRRMLLSGITVLIKLWRKFCQCVNVSICQTFNMSRS